MTTTMVMKANVRVIAFYVAVPRRIFLFFFFLRPPTGVRNPEKHFEKINILTLSLKHEERDAHTEEGQTLVMKGKY